MKLKRIVVLIALFVATLMFAVACASSPGMVNDELGGAGESGLESGVDTTSGRKIIYDYYCNIYTEDIAAAQAVVSSALAGSPSAYVQSSESGTSGDTKTANYVIRVPSGDFNDFIQDIRQAGTMRNERLSSSDVTANYLDLEARRAAKQAQYDRLLELYEVASLHEMVNISQQLATVEAEINYINSQIANYDSLVEFSTVTIYIYQSAAPPESPGFFAKLWGVIKGSAVATLTFLEYLLYFIIYVLPFAAMIVGIVFLVRFIQKKYRAKKNPPPTIPDDGNQTH